METTRPPPTLGDVSPRRGDDVPVRNDPRLSALLLAFTRLPAAAQAHFLELLNHYLFASPRRRTQLRRHWNQDAPASDEQGDDA